MKKNISSCIVLGIILFSCKVNYQEVSNVIKVNEAFIQEEIPGQQGEKTLTYLTINFSETPADNISIDSIFLVNTSVPTLKGIHSVNFTLKKEIRKGKPMLIDDGDAANPLAIIYFKKDKKLYRQTVSPILLKSPLYLP